MTIVELVIGVVIMGFVVLSLLKMYGDLVMNVGPEYRTTQVMIAKELMEHIRSRRFDELFAEDGNGNWSTSLGVDPNETSTNASTFDDIDDFNGFSESLSQPYYGFSRSVTVNYVAAADLNTPLAIPNVPPANWTPPFKRITVTVSKSGFEDVTLDTVISDANRGVSP
jgi:hypothetical protein